MATYQARDPRAQLNTLRSLPLYRPAAAVFGAVAAPVVLSAAPVVRLVEQPAPALALAQAALKLAEGVRHNARLEYVAARRSIGTCNRTSLPATRYSKVIQFTAAEVRQRRSTAFRSFNRSLAALRAADRAVAEALVSLAALGVGGEGAAPSTRFIARRDGVILDIIVMDGERTLAGLLDHLRAETAKLGTILPNGRSYCVVWGSAFLEHAADPTITIAVGVVS